MRERGSTIPVGEWWLTDARKLVASRKGRKVGGLGQLGMTLARHIGRKSGWKHGYLSNFANAARDPKTHDLLAPPTLELVQALCLEFPELVPPVYMARSQHEAFEMFRVQKKHDGRPHDERHPDAPQIPDLEIEQEAPTGKRSRSVGSANVSTKQRGHVVTGSRSATPIR